jgi:hypothetical protein
MKTFALLALAAALVSVGCASAASTKSSSTPRCSAAGLSASLPKQKLPAEVARVRARIAAAAVACDYAALQRIALEKGKGFAFSYGSERSAAAYWRRLEAQHRDRPLARLVKILALPVTRNETGAYAWPSAYTEKPKASDWNALVRKGVYTRAEATRMRNGGNVYLGYRNAITRTGDWQFFVSGD